MKLFNIKGKIFKEYQLELEQLIEEKIVERIWQKDYTVWNKNPKEISDRLGWLNCVNYTRGKLEEIYSFVEEIKTEGFTDVLLIGMGGSSLAPETFAEIFGNDNGKLKLHILDSTHPLAVKNAADIFNIKTTLFIISTKSGGTIETISLMKYFYNYAKDNLGNNQVGKHFVAITDPGSELEEFAKKLEFRKIFLNDPNIGGRFSALSIFGIVPASLIGVDIEKLFIRADIEIQASKKSGEFVEKNIAAQFGVLISVLAKNGKDKLTIVTSKKIQSFSPWIEQLIAESTGKEGRGILPVVLEDLVYPSNYSQDRVFVVIKVKDDIINNDFLALIEEADFPIIEFELGDIYDLSRQIFMWELATAVAGWSLKIQPFDQPNVEQSKISAKKIISDFQSTGSLILPEPIYSNEEIKIYSEKNIKGLYNALSTFLSDCIAGQNYVAFQVYMNPNQELFKILQIIRKKVQIHYKVATTLGLGPRFLHSTGQLHKGDGGKGFFVQFIDQPDIQIDIPNEPGILKSSISFNLLIKAQAFGDRQALIDNGRNVLTILFKKNVIDNLKIILDSFD